MKLIFSALLPFKRMKKVKVTDFLFFPDLKTEDPPQILRQILHRFNSLNSACQPDFFASILPATTGRIPKVMNILENPSAV